MAATALDLARSAWRAGVDFALPPRCPSCGTVVEGDHRFCGDCWQKLEFLGSPSCIRCALPLEHGGGEAEPVCGACHAHPPAFDRAAAAVAYGEIARAVALRLKHGRRPGIARTMAALMARLARDAPEGAVVVAVPLHRWRLWSRGYNQALLIARALARTAGRRCLPDALVRTRATPVLRGLGRRARAETVRGAFAVPSRWTGTIAGRVVLLIDDVFTTGPPPARARRR